MISNEKKQVDVESSTTTTSSPPAKPSVENPLPDSAKDSEQCSLDNAEINDEKSVSKEDCDALYKECVRVQVGNLICAKRIRHTNKLIKRIQKERRFLMKKLDEFGDNYHAEKVKLVDKEERRIAAILQEDVEFVANDRKKSKKKVKVKRLQNAPKKPTNAFLMFCQKNRDLVQEQYKKTDISRQEMTKKLAEIWQKTPQEDRKTYYEMYEKDKARYAQEMKDFERKSNMTTFSAMEEAPSASPSVKLLSKDLVHPGDNIG